MNCSTCGSLNLPGNRFCNTCGSALSTQCPTCGNPNPPEARFCGSCGSALGTDAAPAPSPTEPATAERRLVTVLFTDLVGFTTLAEDRDPEAVRDLLSRYFDTATRIVDVHAGTVEKFIGDAVMAVWGTPVAHEDDPERAVRAALELVDAVGTLHPDLQARAALLTGEAAVTLNAQNQGMVAGDLVNTAARLQGVAEPGTVLVGETTMRAAGPAIVFEAVGDHSLKGKTSPIPAWRAMRVVANRGGQGRGEALEAPFVGRVEELRELKDLLHGIGRDPRPRLVSITGPGGIGKSRLVWELEKYVDGVAEDVYWHRGRSPSYGEGITFWALGEMVRRRAQLTEDDDEARTRERIAATLEEYVPDASDRERIGPALLSLLGVEDAPPGGRDALFPAWRSFFERIADQGTTVLVFEDLQWADSGLLDFIDHLLEWSRRLPILVIGLARPELFDRRPDWGARHRQLTAMALEPLADAEMRQLLEGLVPGLPGDALAAIIGRAEGFPLYAVEMVRGLLADGRIERSGDAYVPAGDLSELRVPESLRALIASRLDGLEPGERSLLQDASVLGQVFSAEALTATTGLDASEASDRLRNLVRRELLDIERDPASPDAGQYKFVQALIREVAYGTLSRRDRRARHLAVARHFEAVGDEELAGALASHYVAAHRASDEGPEADAIAAQARLALSAAASRAGALGSHRAAAGYLEQALSLTDDHVERAELLERAASSAASAAMEDAVEYAVRAVEARRTTGDRDGILRASVLHGWVLLQTGGAAPARDVLEAAYAEAGEEASDAARADALANLSRVYMRLADYQHSVEYAERALTIAEPAVLDDVVAEAVANKAASLTFMGRTREAVALYRLAIDMAAERGLVALEMRVRHNLANTISETDPRASVAELREALELTRQTGERPMYNFIAGSLAGVLVEIGEDWDEVLDLMRDAFESTTLRGDRLRLRMLTGVIETARGERLDELVPEIDALAAGGTESEDEMMTLMARGNTALVRGDLRAAYRYGAEASALPTQVPEVGAGLAVRAAAWLRDSKLAREASDRLASIPGGVGWQREQQASAAAAADALEGRIAEAQQGFRLVRAEFERLGTWFSSAVAALGALHVLPDDPFVRAWAEEARPIFERLRARPYLERLDAVLAEIGAEPESVSKDAPAPARSGASGA